MTIQSIPNQTTDQSDRPFTVCFSKHDSSDRDELERFMSDTFRQAYGAEIKCFKPYLMSLRDQDNKLIAACGLHSASAGRLFMESFLEQPVEAALSELSESPVKRSDIVEIGDFSVAELCMARYLITAINDQLHFTSKQWAVHIAVPELRDAFIKQGMAPEIIADTDINLLPPDVWVASENYFEQKPQIIAIRRMERRNKPRITGSGISTP